MMGRKIHAAAAVTAVFTAAVLLIGALAVPYAQASNYEASYIKKLDDLAVDYTDYLNGSVVHALSESIRPDQEISVIITLDEANLLDAYEASDKAMSFAEYVHTSDEASYITGKIADRKAEITEKLDALKVAYTAGKSYSALVSGFEIVIKAEDYQAVCQSLGGGERAFISEEYKVAETELVENTVNV